MAVLMPLLRAFDALGLCHFCLLIGDPPFLAWLRAATGWDMEEKEFLTVGRRIQALRHAFNAREGITPGHITLPARELGDPPLSDGPLAGITLDPDAMARSYFEGIGIDAETGWPSEAIAAELGLEFLGMPE